MIECIPEVESDGEEDEIDEMTYLEQCADLFFGAKEEQEEGLE
jgi:hypothetical protein